MNNNFLQLNDFYSSNEQKNNVFDDVSIVIDPELEDESTVDIANYLNKFILQCRVCGNMFPSDDLLDNTSECPICDSTSTDGFIFKGKLKRNDETKTSSEKEAAITDLIGSTNELGNIPIEGEFDKYKKDDLTNNYSDIEHY